MPRINLNAKTTVEDCITLSIFLLNKNGALTNSNSGTLSWSNCLGNKSSIAYEINVDRFTPDWDYATPYINLSYSVTDDQNQQKDINQTFYLSRTLCNFGGERMWFICKCGKRVAVLYKPLFEETFKCRHCYNLTYESRNLGGKLKAIGKPLSAPELDELRKGVKRLFYNGRTTKRALKYFKRLEQFKTHYNIWSQNFSRKSSSGTKLKR